MKTMLKNLGMMVVAGALTLGAYRLTEEKPKAYVIEKTESNSAPVHFTSGTSVPAGLDFTQAAEQSVNAVVHIRTEITNTVRYYDPMFEYFFGAPRQGQQNQQASGSGVIIRSDGYIVTNNHVIDRANKIMVTLNNKKTYEAKLIGADPSTDLAILKVDAKGLDPVSFGNSDEVKVGEWVLAVGNPFNLTSTVTAGIVSAKGRSINILKGDTEKNIFPIESFIQTDAAVNPGNSGGALVNAQGELVGINTAIASNTGSYAGYSFAVPVNIVQKVSTDLIETGTVQRAFLGVNIREIDQALADELKIKDTRGVYVQHVVDDGAADASGVKDGDIILSVGAVDVNNGPELLEQIGKFRPGNTVDLRIKRNEEEMLIPVELKSMREEVARVERPAHEVSAGLGATFGSLSKEEKQKLKIQKGVKISSLTKGKLAQVGVRQGFIITKVDDKEVESADELLNYLSHKKGGVLLEGVYPNGTRAYYGFGL